MNKDEERIRKRAHEIWEEEGRPEGREYSRWLRAREEVSREDAEALQCAPPSQEKLERASKADIARSTLPSGTVPENPTAENPDRVVPLRPIPGKSRDGRIIGPLLDKPF